MVEKYRIGLLLGNKTYGYNQDLRWGVQNALEEQGHTLVAVADLVPYHTRKNAQENLSFACEMAQKLELDGYIVPAGCIDDYTEKQMHRSHYFLNYFNPANTLVMEQEVEGFRCIVKENTSGMRECMKSLIEDGGYRKIGFISGPASSHGAQERERVYFEEMEAHDLPTPRSLFARGVYSGDCADVIERMLDDNPDIEAIACACDEIAITAYNVFYKRGIAVGKDIAVTGFDDLAKSAFLDPPLSTVSLTGYTLGYEAGYEVIRLCRGKDQKTRYVSGKFIQRGSDGGSAGLSERYERLVSKKPLPVEEMASAIVEVTMKPVNSYAREDYWRRLLEQIQNAVRIYGARKEDTDLQDNMISSTNLMGIFSQPYSTDISLDAFQIVVARILKAAESIVPPEMKAWMRAQRVNFHHRMSRVFQTQAESSVYRMKQIEWHSLQIVDDALRESDDSAKAYRAILEGFRDLGVENAWIYLYPESISYNSVERFQMPDEALRIGGIRDGRVYLSPEKERTVRVDGVLHTGIRRTEPARLYTAGPLIATHEMLGFVVMEECGLDDDGQMMALLLLGYAFKHLRMFNYEKELIRMLNENNVRLKSQSHHDEMTGLLNRRGFMHELENMIAGNTGRTGAIIYFDLDGLKAINDTFGHETGDDAIIRLAEILKGILGAGCLTGRMGGDEFVGFSLLDDPRDADLIMDTIRKRAARIMEKENLPYVFSVSCGAQVFTIRQPHGNDLAEIFGAADEKLYKEKRTKKNSRRE